MLARLALVPRGRHLRHMTTTLDTLDIRAMQRPDTSAYFMPKPKYHDMLAAITSITKQQLPHTHTSGNKWMNKKDFERKFDLKVTSAEFIMLKNQLNRADKIEGDERSTVQLYLAQFHRPKRHKAKAGKNKRRVEEARAMAWVTSAVPSIPNTLDTVAEEIARACEAVELASNGKEPTVRHLPLGEVRINGMPLAEYFAHGTDRESVLFPLQVVHKLGHYNVFVRVNGGGHTGQAEACQLAVARALYLANRKEHQELKKSGLLAADARFVERKKTGKPKARKSYTWVKR
ncbi:ribosomal protein S9/S16-domain-containing protein [Coemansia spiralis]|nr:ribosomal protein S9/S16-domain-containing protein [Coemansia spiralis]